MVFGAITAAHFGWRRAYYGEWLPNTFYVKVSGGWPAMGARYLGMFGFEYGYGWWAPVMGLGVWRSWLSRRPTAPLLFLYLLPYLAYLVYVGGDHFEYRLLDPVLPALAALMLIGTVEVVRIFSNRTWARAGSLAALALMMLYHAAFPLCTGAHRPERTSGVFRPHADPAEYFGLKYLPGLDGMAEFYNEQYVGLVEHAVGVRWEHHELAARELWWQADRIHEYIERGSLDRHESMCVQPGGIIPYVTRMETLDYFGLTNHDVARAPIAGHAVLFHDKRASPDYIRSRGIDYVQYSDFVLAAREFGGELPALRLRGHDRELIEGLNGRVYLVPMGESYFVFLSARPPDEIKVRFYGRGLEVHEYLLRSDTDILEPGRD
jgi:arabinofuranosyltransferase